MSPELPVPSGSTKKRPLSSGSLDLKAAKVTHKSKSPAMTQTLQAAQVGTGPLPMVKVPIGQYGSRLLDARRRPADLVIVTRAYRVSERPSSRRRPHK